MDMSAMKAKPPSMRQRHREAHRLAWETIYNALPESLQNSFEMTEQNELSIEVFPFGGEPVWVSFQTKARTTMPGDKTRQYCGVTAAMEYAEILEFAQASKK